LITKFTEDTEAFTPSLPRLRPVLCIISVTNLHKDINFLSVVRNKHPVATSHAQVQ